MNYVSHRRIDMRRDPSVSERWLHERILADPTLLGLGEVDRPRLPKQSARSHQVDHNLTESAK